MANSVDPDQEQSVLSPRCLLNSSVILGNYLQQTTVSDAFVLAL